MITVFGGESFVVTAFTQVVAASDFDRNVVVHETAGNTVLVSFTNSLGFIVESGDYVRFVLPVHELLWLASGSASVLVSK